MKNKKIFFIATVAIILAVALIIIINIFKENTEEALTEITPVEEMTEAQERQTIISLYYTNIETNTLIPEARVIDVKDLLENPYKALVENLMVESRNEKLKSSLPVGTKVNNAVLNGDTIELDLSKEFIENQEKDEEKIKLAIYSIVNTLTELNEVNFVKITIDGEENKSFEGTNITLENSFSRQ